MHAQHEPRHLPAAFRTCAKQAAGQQHTCSSHATIKAALSPSHLQAPRDVHVQLAHDVAYRSYVEFEGAVQVLRAAAAMHSAL